MSSILRIKRSEVSGNPGILGAGELAYSALPNNGSNGGDRLYIGTGIETAGNAVNHIIIGGKFFTDMISAATSSKTALTLVKRDDNGRIAADVTGNTDTATAWFNARSLSLSGDATAIFNAVDGTANVTTAITLATVNNTPGVHGSATAIPVFTVNAKGLVTNVTTANIATNLNITGNSGTDAVSLLTDTLSVVGAVGVTSVVTNNTITLSIGQAVGTTDNVTFNNVSVNGVFSSNDITAANIAIDGNATITGNLTVQGTTTTINSTSVAIGDINITLAKDSTSAVQSDGAGLTVIGPNIPATLTYSASNDRWNLNKSLEVSTVYAALIGNATTATTWETPRNLSIMGDATATLSNVNGSASVTTNMTLATVNPNVGTYGNEITVPSVTVNAKGLVTGILQTIIPTATSLIKGLASFNSAQFSLANGNVYVSQIDCGTY